ncbi:hypothetical protein OC835_006988 [Tilletia horrida]|nr:hypothetical protein OC835_006988 [Tilletia horrida]
MTAATLNHDNGPTDTRHTDDLEHAQEEGEQGLHPTTLVHPRTETPLPKRSLAIVFLIRLAEPINFAFILPFINSYVWDLGVTTDRTKVGVYAGWIESLFALSQLFTVLHWASLSDRIGRRPVLITGTLGLILSVTVFGLAQTYAWAIFARCLSGLLNGNVALLRSIVGELCDETNAAKAVVLLPLAWNTGAAVGPLIGGFLVFPARRFPTLFGNQDAPFYFKGLWWHRPYLLPCLLVASLSFVSFLVTVLFLPETLPSKVAEIERKKKEAALLKKKRKSMAANGGPREAGGEDDEDEERRPLLASGVDPNAPASSSSLAVRRNENGREREHSGTTTPGAPLSPRSPFLEYPDPNSSGISLGASARILPASTTTDTVLEEGEGESPSSSSMDILRIPHVRSVLLSFSALSFCGTGFEAVLVLFMYEPLDLGGIRFSASQTGTYLGIFAAFSMVVQTILAPMLIHRLGTTRLYRYALLCFPLMALLLPLASAVARWGSAGHAGGEEDPLPPPTFAAVYAIMILFGTLRCFIGFGYAANMLLVNECARLVTGSRLGAMNGFSTMAGCIARACGPSLYTFLFSLTVGPPTTGPANYLRGWLIWAVLFASGVLAGLSTLWIKPIAQAVAEEEERRREGRRRREV